MGKETIRQKLKNSHKQIENWYFGYNFGISLDEDYRDILDILLEEEYLLSKQIYENAVKLSFNDIFYYTRNQRIEWWITWGLDLYRI